MILTLLKTLVFTIVMPGSIAFWIPWFWLRPGVAASGEPWRWIGLAPLLAGIAIYLWCAWDFASTGRGTPAPIDPPTHLVVRGLYRFTRNPMYVGVLAILVGEGILSGSNRMAMYTVAVAAGFNLFVLLYEEPALRRQFGDAYEEYCQTVRRWL